MKKRTAKPKSSRPGPHRSVTPAGTFPIVGVGASAGGLDALKQLLQSLPGNTGMGFVLIQHLDPKHESALTELLSRTTDLPISEVEDGTAVKPDHVYVIPPNTDIGISDGVLHLLPRKTSPGQQHMPIDYFLRSLAADRGPTAIAMILSGTGSDGSLGVRAVKEEGGITFAQDEASAKYPGMPISAVATGCIDFVLPPEKIVEELGRIGRHPYITQARLVETGDLQIGKEDDLKRLFALLLNHGGVNFGLYKPSTVTRRIQRRMVLNKIENFRDYVAFLHKSNAEVTALYEDLLIHVTGFFRDPETFETLETKVFPKLVAGRKDREPIRIWVPGCSTGEEVYSIAMVLLEFLGSDAPRYPIQFFATDVSEACIEKARSGIYVENIITDVSPERLRRFFVKVDKGYQISKLIRDMCVFARHDVTRDPPFSKLDLISCRNLLIYLGAVLQRKVIPFFEYALKPGGFLIVGTSEVINGADECFTLVDKKNKLYTRKPTPPRQHLDLGAGELTADKVKSSRKEGAAPATFDVQKEVDRLLLSRYVPAGVLVNEEMQIFQFRGRTGRFLEPSPGEASLSLTKMVREGLIVDLRSAIQKAKKSDSPVRKEGIEIKSDGRFRTINIEVIPIKGPSQVDRYFLVLFAEKNSDHVETRSASKVSASGSTKVEARWLTNLRNELAQTKASLQSIIEEQETTNEELRSANEEILSSNEELQSTNEELETAKEELQSTNEELTTLNEELQNRNVQLATVNTDLTNLLNSVNIPIVMVGSDLRIRRLTPIAERILNIIPADIGRPIGNIRPDIGPLDLEPLITQAINTITTQERDIQDRNGHWYSLRVRPYRTFDNKIDGAVLTVLDIDALKSEISESRMYAESIVETVQAPLMVLDSNWTVRTANRAFYEMFRVSRDEVVNRSMYELGSGEWNVPALRESLSRIVSMKSEFANLEVEQDFPKIGRRAIQLGGRAIQLNGRREHLVLLAIEDVTERKRAADAIRRSQEMFEGLFESSPDGIVSAGKDGLIRRVNMRIEKMLGYRRDELIGQPVEILVSDRFKQQFRASYSAEPRMRAIDAAPDLCARRKDGTEFPTEIQLSPLESEDRAVALAVIRDVTDRKRAEDQLRLLVEVTGVASEAEDVAAMTSECLTTICRTGNWAVGQAWVLDESQMLLQCDPESARFSGETEGFRRASLAHPLEKGAGLPGKVWKTGKSIWLSDLAKELGQPRAAHSAGAGLKSGFAFPIATGDALIAVWEFFSTDHRAPDDALLKAADGLGRHLALGYLRKNAEHTLKVLTGRLLSLQDEERRRIARELHDSTAQSLAALSMNVAAISIESDKLSPKGAKLLSDSAMLLDQIGGEVRDVARLLHPPMLDEVGLASALDWLAQRSNLQIELDVPGNLERLPQEIELALFRIVQEGLSNVRRHAQTDKATVRLTRSSSELELLISDGGKGIAAARGTSPSLLSFGLGIESMRQRVRQLNGQFDIIPSEPGTTIKVVLPLPTERK